MSMSNSDSSSRKKGRKKYRRRLLILFIVLFVIAWFCSFNILHFVELSPLQSYYYENTNSVYKYNEDSSDRDPNNKNSNKTTNNNNNNITAKREFTSIDDNDDKDANDKDVENKKNIMNSASYDVTASKVDGDNNLTKEQEQQHVQFELELKVPFYVYEDPEINWLNGNATFDGYPISQVITSQYNILKTYKKHSDDYWLLNSAMNHPMRTTNITDAKLVFVPTLLNLFSTMLYQKENRKLCISSNNGRNKCFDGTQKNWFHTLDSLDGLIGKFINNKGDYNKKKDCVIVASHFTSRHFLDLPIIQSCHQFIFETKDVPSTTADDKKSSSTIRIPSMYIGNPCPHNFSTAMVMKSHDFSLIAQMLEDQPSNPRYRLFESRRNICKWLLMGNYSVSHCGSGVKQCSHLPYSKYGFHIRGDSFGSNRLMDTFQSGTVPLFTHIEQYNILPDILPWKELSYFINITSYEEFTLSIQDLLSLPSEDYYNKIQLIEKYQKVFDPSNIYQFDLLMSSLAKRLGLQ